MVKNVRVTFSGIQAQVAATGCRDKHCMSTGKERDAWVKLEKDGVFVMLISMR